MKNEKANAEASLDRKGSLGGSSEQKHLANPEDSQIHANKMKQTFY